MFILILKASYLIFYKNYNQLWVSLNLPHNNIFRMDKHPKYTLYTYFRSSTSWRVRIAFNLLKITPEFKFIHLAKGAQKSEEYCKVNPNHAVPSLVLEDGTVLIESLAIIDYLNDVHGDIFALYPKDPVKRALVKGFCEVINSSIHPYQNLRLLEKVEKDFKGDKIAFAKEWVIRGTDTLEKMLEKTAGKYSFGDQITAADLCLYPHAIGGAARFGLDLTQYKNIHRVIENLKQNDSFVKSEPKNQPDFEA